MGRNDYLEIRGDFSDLVTALRTRETNELSRFIDPEIKVYLSTAKDYADGSQHTLFGIINFIRDLPKTDFFHTRICNFVCRIAKDEAHQAAHVVCQTGLYGNELKYFCFNMMFSNHWENVEGVWKMTEMRMDIVPEEGNYEAYQDIWHFEDKRAVWHSGIHFPCISGEYDSPWKRIPQAEDVLTDEEKCYEAMARYAFGIDHLVFDEVIQATAEEVISDIEPWGSMDQRNWVVFLKYHRQKDRHWGHCVFPKSIQIEGDHAEMELYRMMGHRQRVHPYVYTNENADIEHACAFYKVQLKKTGSDWKITRCNYYLGLVEIGPYSQESMIA
ncbi:MAG: nuclear transport factor 2 family protein [Solobacterium sp.]|nr:nuclear transport factor 2 family protein [Solobacterium sp.]